ncbi:MAG: ABC transporter substrate-binding protein [Rhizobiales bacterium]|jgi:NitT/TauT family transport system substrate-binding protein|nr:ABC transporter substrate-binding protein [Hyphomicrobiales bacterium]
MKLASGLFILAFGLAAVQPAAAEDLFVTQYKNDPSGAVYGVALEKGFFKKHGVDITGIISGAGGGASVRGAMATAIGYGDVSPAPAIAAIEQGQDIKITNITSTSLALVQIVMPNSPIKTAKDLKGKKIGISNPKSLGEMMSVLVMEKAGLKQGDTQMVALGSLSGALTAMENGAVDSTAIPVILYRMRGGDKKYRALISGKELPLLPPQLGIATGKAMKEHPDKIKAIQAARIEAAKFIYEHTDEAIKILTKIYAPLPPEQVAAMVKDLVAVKFWSDGPIDVKLLENTIKAMKYVKMLEKDVDVKSLYTSAFLPANLQK